MKLFVFVTYLFFTFSAFAQSVRFGAEWTFTNSEIIKLGRALGNYSVITKLNATARDSLAKELLKICEDCKLKANPNRHKSNEPKYQISFPNGSWIEIDVDPWVIEINTHSTSAEFVKNKELYAIVFSAAQKIGLSPHQRIGGGHIHVDMASAFGGNELLARNFLVDMFNHPELSMGLLGKDFLNAPPLAILPSSQQKLLADILSDFDSGLIHFDRMIELINTRVYSVTFDKFQPVPFEKYQAVNVTRSTSSQKIRTIELRGFRPPKTFDEFLLQIQLIEARINFLKKLDKPLQLQIPKLNPKKLDERTLLDRFVEYLDETKLSIEEYSVLLPRKFQSLAEKHHCGKLLGK